MKKVILFSITLLFVLPFLFVQPARAEYYQKANCRWSTWLDLSSLGMGYVIGADLDVGFGPRVFSLNGTINLSGSRAFPAVGTGYHTINNEFYFGLYASNLYFKIMLSTDLNGTIEIYNKDFQLITQGQIYFTG